MTGPEYRFYKDLKKVLFQIKEVVLYTGPTGRISYTYSVNEWVDSKINEHLILDRLKEWGIIRNLEYDSILNCSRFILDEEKFDLLYDNFSKTVPSMTLKELLVRLGTKFTNESKQVDSAVEFNEFSSTLKFCEKEILISKTKDSNAHYLLKTIFKDITKIWSYDEISEDWGSEYRKREWKRFYFAARDVNNKIAAKTTIPDFLLVTSSTVRINRKYC